ncbi:helix-turn-helix transcriptional regulator [Rhizobium sp. SIMBA_035]
MRLQSGWSQNKVVGRLHVSFQQVQKYETGTNRVSAAALRHIRRCARCRWIFSTSVSVADKAAITSRSEARLIDRYHGVSSKQGWHLRSAQRC